MAKIFWATWLFAASLCGALPASETSSPLSERAAAVEVIYQLPLTMAPENCILRSNGQLLVTCLTCGTISQLDPDLGPNQTRLTVYTFPINVVDVLGIVELEEDVFAVATGGEIDIQNGLITGPTSVWKVDLRQYQAPTYNSSLVVAEEIAGPNAAILFDGLAVINATRGLLAATDFVEGNIWLIDTQEKKSSVLTQNPFLALGPGDVNISSLALANGLKFADDKLFYTGTVTGTCGYLPVDPATGAVTGNSTVVYNYGFALDDFNFGPTGNVYLTTFAKPDGGILKRAAGTPIGQSGTTQIVDYFATNSVITREVDGNCELIFTVFLQFQVAKATIPGPC